MAGRSTPMSATAEVDPADPWAIARSQYVADLSEDERILFDHATLENLLQASTEEQSSHQQQSRSREILPRLKPFLSAVEDFGTAFDVISNTYSIALAPLWGALRVILRLAQKFNAIFDRIVEIFERVGWILPRFRVYEKVFNRHPRVIIALSTAYLDIINFCGEIKNFIRSIQRSRIKPFTKLFAPLEHHLNDGIARFRLHREDVELEVEACHMIESAKHYEIELRDRELATLERKKQQRKYLRNLLSPIDYCEKQRKIQKARHIGTGQWLFSEENYVVWENSSESAVLSVFGIPGCGKTTLASCLVQQLLEKGSRTITAYHYCDYKDPRSLDPVTIVGTLINGLLERIEITDDLSALIENGFKEGRRSPDESEMFQLLDLTLQSYLDSTIYIVVDGVDEVDEQNRKLLFRFLEHLTKCRHSRTKLAITSRSDFSSMGMKLPHIRGKFRINVKPESVSGDINAFIRHTVQKFITSGDLVFRESSLKDEVVEKLTQGAKGMFLWVSFQMDSLCECDSDAAVRETLKNLPRDLTETYQRLLRKIHNPQRQSLVRRMMQWIVCARRPLHIDELLEAVAFTIEDDHWDHSKIPVDPFRLIRASGNLMIVDEDDQSVQLAHYTVQQFLLTSVDDATQLSFRFQFDREEAERYIGETCVIYLSFNDFETQITRYKNRTKAHMEVIERALLGSESIIHGGIVESTVVLLSKLLRPQSLYKPSNIDFSQYIPQASHGLRSKYELLGYVITEWLYHTSTLAAASQDEIDISRKYHLTEAWRRFQNLVFHKQMLFKFRPWEEIKTKEPELPRLPLVCWAVRNGHIALLRAINDSDSIHLNVYFENTALWFGSKNQPFLSGETKCIKELSTILLPDLQQMVDSPTSAALFFFISEACARGNTEIIKLYISTLAQSEEGNTNLNETTSVLQLNAEYLMIEAAANAKSEICSNLAPYSDFQAVTMYNGRPCGALKRAALMGHTEVVSVLQLVTDCWEVGTKIHVQEEWAEAEAKMLIDATRAGNLSVVTTLLSVCSPHTSIPDAETGAAVPPDLSHAMVGQRALMQAIYIGHKDVVIHLLSHDVSPNGRIPWILFDTDQDHSKDSILSIPRTVEIGCFGLHLAIARNNREMVKLLLTAGVDPELAVDEFEMEMNLEGKWISPLAHASAIGNIEIAQDLLEHGASIEGQGVSCATWEGLRFRHGSPRILTPGGAEPGHAVSPAQFRYFQLRSHMAKKGLQFRYPTPLIQAAASGHLSMMEYLINAGADIVGYDSARNTPLSVVAANGHIEAAKLLIEKGASLGYDISENILRVSPVLEATKYGNLKMLELLLEANASFKTSLQFESAVITAVLNGDLKVVELLLKHGADISVGEETWLAQCWRLIRICRDVKAKGKSMNELNISYGADLQAAGWGPTAKTHLQMAQEQAQISAAEIVLSFYSLQIERSADVLTAGSSIPRNSQEVESAPDSRFHIDTMDVGLAREAELNSKSDKNPSLPALVRGLGLEPSLESQTASLVVDT